MIERRGSWSAGPSHAANGGLSIAASRAQDSDRAGIPEGCEGVDPCPWPGWAAGVERPAQEATMPAGPRTAIPIRSMPNRSERRRGAAAPAIAALLGSAVAATGLAGADQAALDV